MNEPYLLGVCLLYVYYKRLFLDDVINWKDGIESMRKVKVSDQLEKEASNTATVIMKNFQGTTMDSYACFLLVNQIKEAIFKYALPKKAKGRKV